MSASSPHTPDQTIPAYHAAPRMSGAARATRPVLAVAGPRTARIGRGVVRLGSDRADDRLRGGPAAAGTVPRDSGPALGDRGPQDWSVSTNRSLGEGPAGESGAAARIREVRAVADTLDATGQLVSRRSLHIHASGFTTGEYPLMPLTARSTSSAPDRQTMHGTDVHVIDHCKSGNGLR